MKIPKRPNALLDTVIATNRLRCDAHLADELKVTRATVSRVRKGKPPTANFKLALATTFGMTLKRINELDPSKEKA